MTQNKYLFIGFALVVVGILTFLGYSYYSTRKSLRKYVSSPHQNADNRITKTQEHPTRSDVINPQSFSQLALSPVIKSAEIKQDYQPTETEKLFYQKVADSLEPKQISRDEGNINWTIDIYKAFPPRECYPSLHPETLKQYEDSVFRSRQYYKEIMMNLDEIIKQFPDSAYYSLYQETITLITQMQNEDEVFYDKYEVRENYSSLLLPDVLYRTVRGSMPDTMSRDEKINAYVHCLRYSYFYKSNGLYTMEFGDGMSIGGDMSRKRPILSGAKLAGIGAPAVPAVLNILEDRRPIIAVDEDKIPSRFYRYQDAAVEILQRMFPKAQRPFPIELSVFNVSAFETNL